MLRLLPALAAAIALVAADALPPRSLIAENVRAADAIVKARIDAAEMRPGGPASTTVTVLKVYRGPLRPGDRLTYPSFRETAQYDQAWRDHGMILFLRRDAQGGPGWGTAIDFSEFGYSPRLERRVLGYLRRK